MSRRKEMTLKEKLQNIAVEKSDIFDDLTSAEKETDRLLSQISAMIYRKRKKMQRQVSGVQLAPGF